MTLFQLQIKHELFMLFSLISISFYLLTYYDKKNEEEINNKSNY